ncbi:MAG: hypothetical protein JF922_08870 [Candidatus Dormibacteraeota bacterium]|uniref:Uncharacterized protein n=1 Tax=Candidatus Nephthysia bennettiae TaxID=3127016 RepID=A0A934K0A3_9BACT|nr:hypothetical protein [Candidatus Dormibacteraeota bacterium]
MCCGEPAANAISEVIVPGTGGLGLELSLCPTHRGEVERGLDVAEEAIYEAGLLPDEAVIRAGWAGIAS